MKLLVSYSIIVLALLSMSAQASDAPSFDQWLQAMSGPLAGSAVAVLLSWLVEYWPAYQIFDPKYKRLVFFALSLILPVATACLRGALGYAAWSFDPLIWRAIVAGFAAAGVGTVAHTRKL